MSFAIENMKDIPESIQPRSEKRIHTGGNSSVYEWENKGGSYIVKIFSGANSNIAERFEREKMSLIILERNKIGNVPKLLYSDTNKKIIISSKLPGYKPDRLTFDIFMQYYIMSKRLQKDKISIPSQLRVENASDSLLQPIKLISKIKKDLNGIKTLVEGDMDMSNDFYLEAEGIINQKERELHMHKGITEVVDSQQIFSFSDLGPRNMLSDDKQIYFVDFEHAGWDDPIKGIIDLLICPTNDITTKDVEKIVKFIIRDNKEDGFIEKFINWLPILNIKWLTIYIKYNLKLRKKGTIEIGEVQDIYLKGCRMKTHIENVIKATNL